MLSTSAMARVAHGLLGAGTLNNKTLTIAFMEFLSNSDSNSMKSLCLSQGLRDVSPIWGHRGDVPTFKSDPGVIAQWPRFQREMTGVEADWHYVSGHHGAQFKKDKHLYAEAIHQVNNHDRVGLFNHEYHEGRWTHATVDAPQAGQVAHEVFMFSSRDDWTYDLGPQDNPLFNHPHEQAKGVLLIGCNSLIYQASRRMWAKYFPNAVIVGLMSREGCSISQILPAVRRYGREFFTDPKSIDPEDMVWEFNPNPYASEDVVGVVADGLLYWRFRGQTFMVGVNDPLRPYHMAGKLPPTTLDEVEEEDIYA
jgi:hypothetical protein